MTRDTSTSRRRFTKSLAAVSLGGTTLLAGCGEESAYDGGGGDGGGGGGGGTTTEAGTTAGETTAEDGTATEDGTTTEDGATTEGGTTTEGGGSDSQYDGFLAETDNFDGVQDQTGTDQVTVTVGAQGNGGNFAFEPAAVRVSTDTTVQFEWTGEGGQHNAVHQGDAFASDLYEEAGVHFEHQFTESGTFKYVCEPHDSLGMRGVIEVE